MPRHTYTVRRQHPIKGGRTPLPASVRQAIWREVDRLASRFHTSRNFVIETALADTFNIEIDERYDSERAHNAVTPPIVPQRLRRPLRFGLRNVG